LFKSLFGFYSPQLAAFFSAADHNFAKLFSKASKNTPQLAAGQFIFLNV